VQVVWVPLPYSLPPVSYAPDGSDRPWVIDERFPGLDTLGRRCVVATS
jgi:hypothetical protein